MGEGSLIIVVRFVQNAVARGIAGAGLDVIEYGYVVFAALACRCFIQLECI